MDYSLLTEQKISEKYEGLSQDLKNVLSSADTSVIIENIAAKYRLDEEKTTMLIQLVGLVILGFVSFFEDMKEEMKEIIDISPQFIPLIADEIRQKIFSPVINSLQKIITVKRPPTPTPATAIPAPAATPPRPVAPPTASTPPRPVDEYREPTFSMPEIVDLRKAPPISTPMPMPTPSPLPPKSITPTQPIAPKPVIPIPPAAPTPLIEAEPHKPPASTPKPITPTPRPQYIMRPSGAPPTDSPENVLDLRKDKGEF